MKYTDRKSFDKANYFGTGIYNLMMKNNMTGKSYFKPIGMIGKSMAFCNVTFEPGARCFWHIHRSRIGGGQILICTAGEGWYQEEGKEPASLKAGSVVNIAPNILHWHGAKKDSWFSHIAIEIAGDGVKNEFVCPVSDEEYLQLPDITEEEVKGNSNFDCENVFGKGLSNDMFTQYFTGNSFLNPMFMPEAGRPFVANITFEPACRNHWHIHKASKGGGQVLICTAGEGWYQKEGKKARSLKKGDFVYIKPGIKHWHGAKKDKWFSHLSIEIPGQNSENIWLEEVADDYYEKL